MQQRTVVWSRPTPVRKRKEAERITRRRRSNKKKKKVLRF